MKYHLALDAPKITLDHKTKLLAWHHFGKPPETRGQEYRPTAKCLRRNHKVNTIADLLIQESQYEHPLHKEANDCCCPPCTKYCGIGCTHPNSCLKEASHILQDISPKFTPHEPDHLENESTIPEDKKSVLEHAIGPPEGVKLFNQNLQSVGEIHDNFRIFTVPSKQSLEPAGCNPRSKHPSNIVAFCQRMSLSQVCVIVTCLTGSVSISAPPDHVPQSACMCSP